MEKLIDGKVHINDIKEVSAKISIKAFSVGDKVFNSNLVSKEQLATHIDCEDCGKEIKKSTTYQKVCSDCSVIRASNKFNSLPRIEWDGETPVALFGSDQYFFSSDDILNYCDENETSPENLSFVLCETNNFSKIDYDLFIDSVHEDYEFSDEFEKKLKEFNDFLEKEPTNTWFPTNKRVCITSEDVGYDASE